MRNGKVGRGKVVGPAPGPRPGVRGLAGTQHIIMVTRYEPSLQSDNETPRSSSGVTILIKENLGLNLISPLSSDNHLTSGGLIKNISSGTFVDFPSSIRGHWINYQLIKFPILEVLFL